MNLSDDNFLSTKDWDIQWPMADNDDTNSMPRLESATDVIGLPMPKLALAISYWYHIVIILLSYRYLIGIVLVSFWYHTGIVSVSFRYHTGIVLVLYRYRIGIISVLYRYCISIVSVLYRYRLSTTLATTEYPRVNFDFRSVVFCITVEFGFRQQFWPLFNL